jgi:LDH2 family malate/lactate/ureidoglycolate dehydrogenase
VVLPGDRRHAMRAKTRAEGVNLPESLHEQLRGFAT